MLDDFLHLFVLWKWFINYILYNIIYNSQKLKKKQLLPIIFIIICNNEYSDQKQKFSRNSQDLYDCNILVK